jgi:hypothetical protein
MYNLVMTCIKRVQSNNALVVSMKRPADNGQLMVLHENVQPTLPMSAKHLTNAPARPGSLIIAL